MCAGTLGFIHSHVCAEPTSVLGIAGSLSSLNDQLQVILHTRREKQGLIIPWLQVAFNICRIGVSSPNGLCCKGSEQSSAGARHLVFLPPLLPLALQFMTEGEATKAENGELVAPDFKVRFDLSFVCFSGSLVPHVSQQENENNAHFPSSSFSRDPCEVGSPSTQICLLITVQT